MNTAAAAYLTRFSFIATAGAIASFYRSGPGYLATATIATSQAAHTPMVLARVFRAGNADIP